MQCNAVMYIVVRACIHVTVHYIYRSYNNWYCQLHCTFHKIECKKDYFTMYTSTSSLTISLSRAHSKGNSQHQIFWRGSGWRCQLQGPRVRPHGLSGPPGRPLAPGCPVALSVCKNVTRRLKACSPCTRIYMYTLFKHVTLKNAWGAPLGIAEHLSMRQLSIILSKAVATSPVGSVSTEPPAPKLAPPRSTHMQHSCTWRDADVALMQCRPISLRQLAIQTSGS